MGQMSDQALFKAAEEMDTNTDGEYSCEAFFYAGAERLISGDKATAENYFKKSIATNAKSQTEYASAMAELRELIK